MSTQLPTEPRIVVRAEQPYVAVKAIVTMRTMGIIADRVPEVIGWLAERGIEPAGPPFLKYNVIDMERQLEVEAGVPTAAAVAAHTPVFAGVLPAGRYVTVTHIGHPDGLLQVTAALLDWAAGQGLAWDMAQTDDGERWGCRLEQFTTDPREVPGPDKWETELAFRLAD